jgi:L-ascorbate metabolism protein UlaG (beta-lactamase superfamily)
MKITYRGHSAFVVESGQTTILIDPYDEQVGYPMDRVRASFVLVSHEHGDHNNVALAEGRPRVIRGLVEGKWRTIKETVDGFMISSVGTYHDDAKGAKRGRNTVFIIEAEGLRIVHLGDLAHPLDDEATKAIGRSDVLMLPVGGHFTIDAAQAHAAATRLRPGIVIPMHYKTEVNAGWPIATIDPYLAGVRAPKRVGHTITVEKATVPRDPEVWVMTWQP